MPKIHEIPGVAQVREVFGQNDTAYIVMNYIEGDTLKSRLQNNGVMSTKECIEIMLPVIDALSEAHEMGMIHRDISPDNIMVEEVRQRRRVWVMDMGSAKQLDPTMQKGTVSESTHLVIKSGFSPMEQYSDAAGVGPWTDIYALGATIYYCLTGKVPPDALGRLSGKDIDMSKVDPSIQGILNKALAVMPKDRYQSMMELRNAFVNYETVQEKTSKASDGIDIKKKKKVENKKEAETGTSKKWQRKTSQEQRIKSSGKKGGRIAKGIAIVGVALIALSVFASKEPKETTSVMPDLAGMTEEDAVNLLNETNLAASESVYEYSEEIEKGKVISQNVSPDIEVKSGSTVQLVVSKGALIEVPNIVGLTKEEGRAAVEQAGLAWSTEEKTFSDEVKKGVIIKQKPKADKKREEGSEVSVVVSRGIEQVTVPDVIGKDQNTAQQEIEEAKLEVTTTSDYSDSVGSGMVISQSMEAGTKTDKGSEVNLVISLGIKPQPVQKGATSSKSSSGGNSSSSKRSGGSSSGVSSGGSTSESQSSMQSTDDEPDYGGHFQTTY